MFSMFFGSLYLLKLTSVVGEIYYCSLFTVGEIMWFALTATLFGVFALCWMLSLSDTKGVQSLETWLELEMKLKVPNWFPNTVDDLIESTSF